jgi:hypothetical protein
MTIYSKRIGRIHLEVSEEGMRQPDYGHGCNLNIVDGWNDSCPTLVNRLSLEELKDLQYMASRALKRARLQAKQ